MSVAKRIHQTTDALGAVSVLTEQKFLAIGNSVERAAAVLAHLTVTFETLLSEMQSDEVIQAKKDLACAAVTAGRLADAPGSEAAVLERLAHMTEAINARMAAMHRITGDVDMLAINARLVAAGMGAAGSEFLGFAMEIRRFAKLALARLEQVGHDLTDAGRQVVAARSGVMAYAERHGAALRAIPQRLAAAVDTIKAHDDLAVAATTEVATRTADVHRQVGSMIVELQLGDVTRQRVQHMQEVAGVLLSLASPSSALPSEWRTLTGSAIASLLQSGSSLIAAQLRDTAGELDREAERVANGLSRLADDARDINSLGEHAFGGTDQQHLGFMAELEADLRVTEALFQDLRAARDETGCRIVNVLAIANKLTGNIDTLRGLEADIRIMGLNTTLKCGRLGVVGRPLGVIAQELRDCGSRTASHAGAALTDLTLLADLARTFSTLRSESPGATIDNFSHELLAAVDLLGRTGRALSIALAGLSNDSGAAAQLLQVAARDFSVRVDLGEVLHSAADELGNIASEQAGLATPDTSATERLLARFGAVYTMARERQVHLQSGGPLVQQSDPVAEPDLSDVLF